MTAGSRPRVALFLSFSGHGGVEHMMVNLACGLAAAGVDVDLVTVRRHGPHLTGLPVAVRQVALDCNHNLTALLPLVRYLRRERPVALLSAKHRANQVAVLARRLAGVPTRLVLRLGTTLSGSLAGRGRAVRTLWYASMRLIYPRADRVVAVSRGVAQDIAAITGLGPDRVSVIHNPVVTPELVRKAGSVADHPWLAAGAEPVIMGAGRFTRQKDFPTLIRAFARVAAGRDCRLLIAGEGDQRPECEALVQSLGLSGRVAFPGFVDNLPAFVARAAVFVLSSRWEGSPNVLTEALALGVPVVSTDCPSGPREILDNGRYGELVAMGDDAALALAIERCLDAPPAAASLREAVTGYTLEQSTREYLKVLGLSEMAGS